MKKKKQTKKKGSNESPFERRNHCVMTLRLSPELNARLERYIEQNSEKQRQKKKIIVYALERFLGENE